MPSIFEQLAAAGVELNDEQRAKIDVESSDEVKGLRDSRDTLLKEKQQIKKLAEQAELDRQAALEAQAAKDGDVEALRKQYADRESSLMQKLQDRDNRILGGQREIALTELSGEFIQPDGGRLMIANMIKTSYSEDGSSVVTEYFNERGESLGNDRDAFKKYLGESKVFSPFMKGIDSSGGGANGGKGSGATDGKTVSRDQWDTMSHKARADFSKSGGKVVD